MPPGEATAISNPPQRSAQNAELCGELLIDPAIHTDQVALRACYALAGHATFRLETTGDGKRKISFDVTGDGTVAGVINELQQLLIDFSIRADLEVRTSDLRNSIWATAFAELRGSARR